MRFKGRLTKESAFELYKAIRTHSAAKNALSNNVGDVKHNVRTLLPALVEERHFALVVGLRVSNLRLASNRQGQELGPTQPSLRSPTAIMITCSNSPLRGAGCPIITSVIYCPPSGFPGFPACEPN